MFVEFGTGVLYRKLSRIASPMEIFTATAVLYVRA